MAAVLVLAVLPIATPISAAELEFILPFNTMSLAETEQDPQIRASRAMLDEVMAGSAITWTARAVPSARGLVEIERSSNVCGVYVTPRTAEARGLIYRDLIETQFVMIARAGAPVRVDGLEDAGRYRIGTILNTQMHRVLDAAGVPAELVGLDSQNYRKLIQDRIDLWFTTLDNFRNVVPESERAFYTIAYRGDRVRTGLACNPSIDAAVMSGLTVAAARYSRADQAQLISARRAP